jgi:hypothetical protein
MMSWRYTSGFSVHSQTRLSGSDAQGKEQLARYIARNPVSQARLSICPDGMVHYALGHRRHPGDKHHEILHPLSLSAVALTEAEVSRPGLPALSLSKGQHIPDPYEPLSFMVGRYANRTRGLARKREQHLDAGSSTFAPTSHHEADTPYRKQCRKRWAELIRKVWIQDPLVCAKCGGPMRVISFITDWPVINKILEHLGLDTPDPPGPVGRSPPLDEFMHIP